MSKNKKPIKNNKSKNRDVAALFFALAAVISAYSIMLPENSGIIGEAFAHTVFLIFGGARCLIPIILLWYFVLSTISSLQKRQKLDFLWSVMSMAAASTLLITIKILFKIEASGGWIG